MPGLSRNHDVEGSTRWLPLLELGDLDGKTALLLKVSHSFVRVDAEHMAAGLLEGSREDARANPDVKDIATLDGREDRVDHPLRIGRTCSLIALRFATE